MSVLWYNALSCTCRPFMLSCAHAFSSYQHSCVTCTMPFGHARKNCRKRRYVVLPSVAGKVLCLNVWSRRGLTGSYGCFFWPDQEEVRALQQVSSAAQSRAAKAERVAAQAEALASANSHAGMQELQKQLNRQVRANKVLQRANVELQQCIRELREA